MVNAFPTFNAIFCRHCEWEPKAGSGSGPGLAPFSGSRTCQFCGVAVASATVRAEKCANSVAVLPMQWQCWGMWQFCSLPELRASCAAVLGGVPSCWLC